MKVRKNDPIIIPVTADEVVTTTLGELFQMATGREMLRDADLLVSPPREKEKMPGCFFPADHTPHVFAK